jgi:hypothetical protein
VVKKDTSQNSAQPTQKIAQGLATGGTIAGITAIATSIFELPTLITLIVFIFALILSRSISHGIK